MSDSKDKQRSRMEREIIDILDEMETREPPRRARNVVDFRQPRQSFFDRIRTRIPRRPQVSSSLLTPLRLLILSVVAALSAVFVDRYSETLSLILVLVAVAAFFALIFVRSPRGPGSAPRPPETKRWRGKDISLKPERPAHRQGGWRRFLPGNRRD